MKKRMKFKTRLLPIFILLFASPLFAGSEGKGDFGHASELLVVAQTSLLERLYSASHEQKSQIERAAFQDAPDIDPVFVGKITLDFVVDGLSNIAEKRLEPSEKHGGRTMISDYDPKSGNPQIVILSTFYIQFGQLPAYMTDSTIISEIQIRLLKELSHLWGMNDRSGRSFGIVVLNSMGLHVDSDQSELERRLFEHELELAEVNGRISAFERAHSSKKAAVNVNRPGDFVNNECLDWALKSWLFLGVGGLICEVDNGLEKKQIRNSMDAKFAQKLEPLYTRRDTLEKLIVTIQRKLGMHDQITQATPPDRNFTWGNDF